MIHASVSPPGWGMVCFLPFSACSSPLLPSPAAGHGPAPSVGQCRASPCSRLPTSHLPPAFQFCLPSSILSPQLSLTPLPFCLCLSWKSYGKVGNQECGGLHPVLALSSSQSWGPPGTISGTWLLPGLLPSHSYLGVCRTPAEGPGLTGEPESPGVPFPRLSTFSLFCSNTCQRRAQERGPVR